MGRNALTLALAASLAGCLLVACARGGGDAPAPQANTRVDGLPSQHQQPSSAALARSAERAVGDYIGALDSGDGRRACALLVADAIDALELPRNRDGCAASLKASIGYRDPRGLPVFEGARLAGVASVEVSNDTAKVVATVVTFFSDRDEPSVEDDVVYLVREGSRWLVAKPSSTFYRAIGVADVPPSVLAPPPG